MGKTLTDTKGKPVVGASFALLLGLSAGGVIAEDSSALSRVEHALASQAQQQSLNALVHVDGQGALKRAAALDALPLESRGPLHGMPVVIKDNIHVANMPNTAGTRALANFIPTEDAGVVSRLKEAGAIVLAKANLHELAYGITSNNHYTGAVQNPAKPGFFAGGSSGGTAAAVAAGIVPAGLGTDTGGSTRIPAALTGIVGFRPSMGRYPSSGMTMISNTRDTAGPMGVNVETVAALDAVLAGEPQGLKPIEPQAIRLGIARDYFFQQLEPAVAKATDEALQRLGAAGVQLIEIQAPGLAELNEKVSFPVVLHETAQLLPVYLKEQGLEITPAQLLEQIESPDVKAVVGDAFAGAIPLAVYQDAVAVYRPALQAYYQGLFDEHNLDALVFPTTPMTARQIKGSEETVNSQVDGLGEPVPTFPSYIRNTDPSSNTGTPGISLPMAKSPEGLPIGLELDGAEGADRHLLAVARALEALIVDANEPAKTPE